MVQMIALDLDGTLLQPDSTLSAAAEDALTKAISQGICIVVASGRAFTALPEKIRHFAGIRYAVTSNGATVSELPAGKLLCAWTLPEQAVLDLLKMQQAAGTFLIEAGIGGQMYAPEEYLNNPEKYRQAAPLQAYLKRTRKPVADMTAFLLEHQHEIDCIDLICPECAEKDRLRVQVQQEIADIYVTSSTPELVEIAHAEAGKANGLRFLSEQTGIPAENILAFGNADNDAEMLAYAGIGVAVANASDTCKQAADRITLSHTEDGVAKTILEYLH